MSNLGPQWEDDEDYSPARMDAKNILRDTGTAIIATAATRQLGAVCPTDTSGGLIKDVLYVCEYDGGFSRLSFKPVFHKHVHDADTDAAGGTLMDIYHANSAKTAQIDMLYVKTSDWTLNTVGSTPTLTIDIGTTSYRLKFDTDATTNNSITGSIGGIRLSFASKMSFQGKIEFPFSTSLLARLGINVDRVDETQDTARRQIGMEGCDAHGTNWVIINANGSAASLTVTPTTSALNPGSVKNYKVVELPSSEVRFYEQGVSTGFSTTNVATSGDTDGKRLFRTGIKTTTGSTRYIYLNLLKIIADPGASDLA